VAPSRFLVMRPPVHDVLVFAALASGGRELRDRALHAAELERVEDDVEEDDSENNEVSGRDVLPCLSRECLPEPEQSVVQRGGSTVHQFRTLHWSLGGDWRHAPRPTRPTSQLQTLQELDEVALLLSVQSQSEAAVVVLHDCA
jgi:hypothetical protein